VHVPIRSLAAALLLAGPFSFAAAEPLGFARALELAQRQSPGLDAGEASVRAAQDERQAAGHLPDPRLLAGVDNYPVSGPMRGSLDRDFMTMRKLGLMQEFPSAAKRLAQVEAASAGVGIAESQRRITRWKVRLAAARAWLERYFLERKLEAFQELARDNTDLSGALLAQLASGRSDAVDSVEQQQELARVDDRRDELAREIARATAALRALVGSEADSPIAGDAPELPVQPEALRAHLDAHPELQAFSAQQAAADADLHAAKADRRPDWSVELAYAKRGSQFGDMVSVQFAVALPFFGSRRLDPLVDSRMEQRRRLESEREAMRRERAGELDASLAERDALDRQLLRARQTALPLAQRRVDLQTAAYAAGRSTLAGVLAARRELCELRLRSIDLQGQLAAVTAGLYFTFQEGSR
jgi:outer membrane protein, heavy metal efflux system